MEVLRFVGRACQGVAPELYNPGYIAGLRAHGGEIGVFQEGKTSTKDIELNVSAQPVSYICEFFELLGGKPIESNGKSKLLVSQQLDAFYTQIKIARDSTDQVV